MLFVSASERGGGQGDLQQQRQPSGPAEEAQEGPDGLHGPPAGPAGAQLRAAEVPERPGPHGAGGLPQPHRHAGQDLVPEPEVGSHAGGREGGLSGVSSAGLNGHRDAMFHFARPEFTIILIIDSFDDYLLELLIHGQLHKISGIKRDLECDRKLSSTRRNRKKMIKKCHDSGGTDIISTFHHKNCYSSIVSKSNL